MNQPPTDPKAAPPPEPAILRWFRYEHLQDRQRDVSRPYAELARSLARAIPDGPERAVALRKLLESKDAAVRASLPPEAP